uniref:BPTI/Kunitz inhibitor domain-containing protein n=1 Tax=Rhabditophanes sp. KR3021 TaxID=114890 RepID=A0AC35TK88_9BILA
MFGLNTILVLNLVLLINVDSIRIVDHTHTYTKRETDKWCDYLRKARKVHMHPICMESEVQRTTRSLPPQFKAKSRPVVESEESVEVINVEETPESYSELPLCRTPETLVQCKADLNACPKSGQVCYNTDNSMCCQQAMNGLPVSHIHSKSGSCPQPLGISMYRYQDTKVGCWLDGNCPGIQKCCLEPNPVTNSAARICRDPIGLDQNSICNLPLSVGTCSAHRTRFYFDSNAGKCKNFLFSGCGANNNNFQSLASCQANCQSAGKMGSPSCPGDASIGLNCFYSHSDACQTDTDCMGRENTPQPSCCMTKCGYRICYQY